MDEHNIICPLLSDQAVGTDIQALVTSALRQKHILSVKSEMVINLIDLKKYIFVYKIFLLMFCMWKRINIFFIVITFCFVFN